MRCDRPGREVARLEALSAMHSNRPMGLVTEGIRLIEIKQQGTDARSVSFHRDRFRRPGAIGSWRAESEHTDSYCEFDAGLFPSPVLKM